MTETTLDWLFHPRSIAVVGVSDRKPHIKDLFLNSQRNMGFAGQLYAVSNRKEAVSGYPTYARVSDIPGPVDHVILAVPAARVRAVLEDCVAKGVRSVHAFTSGFAFVVALDFDARFTFVSISVSVSGFLLPLNTSLNIIFTPIKHSISF